MGDEWVVRRWCPAFLGVSLLAGCTHPMQTAPPNGLDAAPDSATAVSLGVDVACAIVSGQVACWGDWKTVDFGAGVSSWPTPVAISGVKNAVALGAAGYGTYGACALIADGSVWCWDNLDLTGIGPATAPQMVPGITGVSSLAVGPNLVCVTLGGTSTECMGNPYGSTFVPVSYLSDAALFSIGEDSWLYALAADGTILSGIPDLPLLSQIDGGLPKIAGATALAAGSGYACALVGGGSVECWGTMGAIVAWPQPVFLNLPPAAAIGAGPQTACAVVTDGTVMCWGSNASGQLGDGTTTDSTTPVLVSGLTGAVSVSVGANGACALLSNHTIECWGQHTGAAARPVSKTPVQVSF